MRKGQITLFILVGLVVLVGFGIIYGAMSRNSSTLQSSEGQQALTAEEQEVRDYVQACMDKTAKEAAFYFGFVGGRISPDPFALYYSYDDRYTVPYYYFEGKNNIPVPYDEGYWTSLLAKYVGSNLPLCTGSFGAFPGRKIEPGKVKPKVMFTDESVVFSASYPVRVAGESTTVSLNPEYSSTVPVRLRGMLKVATTIVEEEVKSDKYIHWDFLTEVTGNGYNITAYTEDNNTIVYRMIDLQNTIDEEPFVLQWANKMMIVK